MDMFMSKISDGSTPHNPTKITIVGAGQTGMSAAYSMLVQGVANELALIDVSEDRLKGEMMDLQHGQAFLRSVTIKASSDYSISAGSKICIVTAGARMVEGENRMDLVQRNVEVFKQVIPKLIQYCPDTLLIIVSDPVDILTHVAWKLSGLPISRVIGTGTMLDSSRFKFLLSERFEIAPESVHGYVIGEHGDSSVAVWSGVNIAGTLLSDKCPTAGGSDDPEDWESIHKEVIKSAYDVIKLKGYTNWAIGTAVAELCTCILKDTRDVYALSTMATKYHGIEQEVFLSLPCVVGEKGVTHVIDQTLSDSEKTKLKASAATLHKVLDGIKY